MEEIPEMSKKWINPYFVVPISDQGLSQLSKISSKEKPSRRDIVMGFTLLHTNSVPNKITTYAECKLGLFDPMFNFIGDTTTVVIRFRDRKDDEYTETPHIKYALAGQEEEYLLSPIDFLKNEEVFHKIEFTLLSIFKLQQFNKDITYLTLDPKGDPLIRKTDGVFHYGYEFEKRVKLYLACPECEKIFFSLDLPKKVSWIFSEKDSSEHMMEYCIKIKEILQRNGLNNLI